MLKLNCELVAGKSFCISSTAAAYNHEKIPVDIVDELCLRFWILAASEAIMEADAMSARLAFWQGRNKLPKPRKERPAYLSKRRPGTRIVLDWNMLDIIGELGWCCRNGRRFRGCRRRFYKLGPGAFWETREGFSRYRRAYFLPGHSRIVESS